MADTILSLFDVSTRLGVSPSAIKKRVASLNLPVERGARGKLLFNAEAYALLCRADELLKAGQGFEECRRQLGLDVEPAAAAIQEEAPETREAREAPEPALPVEAALPLEREAIVEAAMVPEAIVEAAMAPEAIPEAAMAPEAIVEAAMAPEAIVEAAMAPEALAASEPHAQALPAPVFIQLGRRKPSDSVRMRMIEHQPSPTPMSASPEPVPSAPTPPSAPAPVIDPDLLARLDGALRLIGDKDKQNQTLQSKLLVAYDEMTKLSATAAAFQERSLNLQHEVQKLQGEIRLLTAPPDKKPWWKFWA